MQLTQLFQMQRPLERSPTQVKDYANLPYMQFQQPKWHP